MAKKAVGKALAKSVPPMSAKALLVAIDLKLRKFKAEYKGQMELYLR